MTATPLAPPTAAETTAPMPAVPAPRPPAASRRSAPVPAGPPRTPSDTGPHAARTPSGTGPHRAHAPSDTGPHRARTPSDTGPHPARTGSHAVPAPREPSGPAPWLVTAGCAPLLTASMRPDRRPASLRRHREVHGELRRIRRGELTELIASARLRGRGGAGFPVADKLRTAAAGRRAPEVVVNGAESEPASIKDRALLTRAPHLVLDGAQLLADELGARTVTVWVHAARAAAVLTRAIEQRAGTDRVPVTVVRAPDGYLAGESSAALAHLAGGPARPAFALRPAAVEGPGGRPVVVNNVESVAAVAVLAAHGLDRLPGAAAADEPGTRLLTVHRAPGVPVLVEAANGTRVRDVLAVAGLPARPVQAVLVGGYFGRWLTPEAGLDVPLSHAGLTAAGGSLGAGVVIAPPGGGCVLAEVAAVVEHLAAQNAGQCGPCVNGLPALARVMTALAAGDADAAAVQRVHDLAGIVTGRGACKHPDGVAMFAGSALAALSGEVAAHLAGGCGLPNRGWLTLRGGRSR